MSNLELGRGIHFGMSGQQCQIVLQAQERVGLANSVILFEDKHGRGWKA